MGSLNKKLGNSSSIKLGLGILLCSTFLYTSYGHGKEGLSKSRQAKLIMQDYQPLYSGVESSQAALTTSDASALQRRNEYCDAEQYPRDQYCLERRYMNDGHYIVTISFRRDQQTPIQPAASYIEGSYPYREDTTARDTFLIEQKENIVTEYLGSDYQLFNSVELVMSKSKVVVIDVQVSDASELSNILSNSRVVRVKHIGSPSLPLEEITP